MSFEIVNNWGRSVTGLGNPEAELRIQKALEVRYPMSAFAFHIEVRGGAGTEMYLRIWGPGIDDRATAYPEDFLALPGDEQLAAIVSNLDEMIDRQKPTPEAQGD